MKSLADRMRECREALGLNQIELAKKAGVSPSTIGNIESGTRLEPRSLLQIARALGVSPEWLQHGKAPSERVLHGATENAISFKVPKKPLSWREMMEISELPEVFEAVLPDDAMAPDLPAGRRVEFDTRETPVIGDHVLIRDRDGELMFRLYKQAPAKSWEGFASNRAFLDVLPERDGAVVVAVMTGYFVPRR